MINLINLHKTYFLPGHPPLPALTNINLQVSPGEIFGIIGESGAGKSTLIRCVNLLEKPTSGQVFIDGEELTQMHKIQLRQERQKIGMIFQHFNLLNSRTVFENVAFPLELTGLKKTIIRSKVESLLELTGLSGRRNHYPNQLSGGQKQRVAIARALANEPKVLLSDEATSALDPETKFSILELLNEINARLGLTILLITHEMQVIKQICHRVALLEKGEIIEQSDVLSFFNQPQTPVGKKFIRSVAVHDLPEIMQARIIPEKAPESSPLLRLSFFGAAAEEPLITTVIRSFDISVNILQAHIENIRNQMLGVMLVEIKGEESNILQAISFLESKGIHVEAIGYVKSII